MADGAMTLPEAVRAKLEQTAGPVLYSDIAAHLARDAVFVVARSVSLIEGGVAVATDDVTRVEAWVASGELRKPSRAEREAWPADAGRRWLSVVVQPFILVQDFETAKLSLSSS
jgi:hypothetical protein